MRKILFLILTILAVVGCSKSENESVTISLDSYSDTKHLSKDSIHEYGIYTKNHIDLLYKRIRNGETKWEKPFIKPNPIIIDLGYGEKLELDYHFKSVVLDTDNFIYTLMKPSDPKYTKFYQIGRYSINGDFIENKMIELENKRIPLFIETYDKNILLKLGASYAIVNPELDVIEQKDVSLEVLKHTKFIRQNQYITYNEKQVFMIEIENNKKINIDLNSFVTLSYPEEKNTPRYNISDVKTSIDYVDILLSITLYNGEKKTIKGRFSYDSGELMI